MGLSIDKIKISNEHLNLIKSILKDVQQGALSDEQLINGFIPKLRYIHQIGAVGLFHTCLEALGTKYENNIEFQICKMLDCYENFDYTSMAYWLYQIKQHSDLSLEQRTIVACNTIFANANGGHFDTHIDGAIEELEKLVYDEDYFTFECLENLMEELEAKEPERLIKYINFLENYECKNWTIYNWITLVLFNHYKRSNEFTCLKTTVSRFSNGINKYNLTANEMMVAEVQLLRLLFESRNGRWEEYSIQVFNKHNDYLNADIEVALCFTKEFIAIIRDGEKVYGRILNENYIHNIARAINIALNLHLDQYKQIADFLSLDMLNSRRFWLEVSLGLIDADIWLYNYNPSTYLNKITSVYNSIINLCKLNHNKREYLHWLLCFTNSLFALSTLVPDVKYDIRSNALQLEDIIKKTNYCASVSYYIIFLANIWDNLGEEEKAINALRRFHQSGANVNVYNLSIQQIYIKLENKYRLLPSDNRRELLDLVTLLTDLNSQRDIQEAIIIAEKHFTSLNVSDDNFMVYVEPENVLIFLLKCSHIFLNANRFDLVDQLWDKVCYINRHWCINPEINAELHINHALGLFRRGQYNQAYDMMSTLQCADVHDIFKLRALIIMGDIEAAQSWPTFRINSLSKALGLAEKLGIDNEVARIYHKLGIFFGPYYPCLGLSFLRKAETIYDNSGQIDSLYETYLLRAQASLFIHLVSLPRYKSSTTRFIDETKRLLQTYPRSIYKSEQVRAMYDRIYGITYCNTEKLKDSYLFYLRIGIYGEMVRTLESAIIICSINNKIEDALEFAHEYQKVVSEHSDSLRMSHAAKMIEILQIPGGRIDFPDIKSAYSEITLLDILDEISFNEEIWTLDDCPTRNFYPYPKDDGKCEMFQDKDSVVLAPVCQLPFIYYRGQTERHQPCYPTLYRDNMTDADRFVERLKYCEFYILLESHPLSTKFKNSFVYTFPDGSKRIMNFNIYHLALAQHYGIATELMDLTCDKWVAAFFAATKCVNDIYSPYEKDGYGIFYTCKEMEVNNPIIKPIGIQPFSRPGEQRGYALPMAAKQDFEKNTTAIKFKHYPEINEFIFNYTNRSQKLFPHDILKDKADSIKDSHNFSRAAYDMAIVKFYSTTKSEDIEYWMNLKNINLVSRPIVGFSEEDMAEYRHNLPNLMKKIQENIITLSLVHNSPYRPATLYATR